MKKISSQQKKKELIKYAHLIAEAGFVIGSGGNLKEAWMRTQVVERACLTLIAQRILSL